MGLLDARLTSTPEIQRNRLASSSVLTPGSPVAQGNTFARRPTLQQPQGMTPEQQLQQAAQLGKLGTKVAGLFGTGAATTAQIAAAQQAGVQTGALVGEGMFAGMATAGSTGATAGTGAAAGGTASAAPAAAASGPWGWIAAAVAAKAVYDVETGTIDTYSDLYTNPIDSMQKISAADEDRLGQFVGEGPAQAVFSIPQATLSFAEGDFEGGFENLGNLIEAPFRSIEDLF